MRAYDQQGRIEKWLSPPNASINYNDALKHHHKGSGSWFLHSEAFTSWKTRPNSFLWLHGIPGCGKTILSSAIIQTLRNECHISRIILYFYFDFNDTAKQSLEKLLIALISQLYIAREGSRTLLDQLYLSCKHGKDQPTVDQLEDILRAMARCTDEVCVVLDALDEAQARQKLLSWIRDFANSESTNIHLIVTSRSERDIESALSKWMDPSESISIQCEVVDEDIRAYLCARISSDEGLSRWKLFPDVQQEIEVSLMEKARGM